jgi:hypothetical protein
MTKSDFFVDIENVILKSTLLLFVVYNSKYTLFSLIVCTYVVYIHREFFAYFWNSEMYFFRKIGNYCCPCARNLHSWFSREDSNKKMNSKHNINVDLNLFTKKKVQTCSRLSTYCTCLLCNTYVTFFKDRISHFLSDMGPQPLLK